MVTSLHLYNYHWVVKMELVEMALYKERAEHTVTKTHKASLEEEIRSLRQRLYDIRQKVPLQDREECTIETRYVQLVSLTSAF